MPAHEHWSCDFSLLDRTLVRDLSGVSSGHLTDIYLLALAVSRGGVLATFDTRIPTTGVRGGGKAVELIPPAPKR